MTKENLPIAVRCHVEQEQIDWRPKNENSKTTNEAMPIDHENYMPRILVFDTETTTDEYQNLLIVTAMLVEGDHATHIDGFITKKWLIYGEALPADKLPLLADFANRQNMVLLDRLSFVKQVLLPEITFWGSMLVGFNLPFDISRLGDGAITHDWGKQKDEIEIVFDRTDKYLSTIGIQAIDGKRAFIKLHFHTRKKPYNDMIPFVKNAAFLDLHTLVNVLTDRSMTLKQAGEYFVKVSKDSAIKFEANEHGNITEEYLLYNVNDVESSISLYSAVVSAYWQHPVSKPPHKVFSPASLGKAYLEAFGIKPLLENQADFPRDILGYCMAAFYGGRSECQLRREIAEVFHVDFMSQYPSVYTLMDLQRYLIASRIEPAEATAEIQHFLETITLDNLFDKNIWPSLVGIAAIYPDDNLLPVRAEYQAGGGYQIGFNYLSANKLMWYALPDLVASKILTGKTPKIERAYRFDAVGIQNSLQPLNFLGRSDLRINPRKQQIFKRVIEARQEFKAKKKQAKPSKKKDEYETIQYQLKIFANATSYGINVEANRVNGDQDKSLKVYGSEDSWEEERPDFDEPGKFYNPVIGVQITSGAHLLLAMAEQTTIDQGGQVCMMDTDSLMIASNGGGMAEEIGRYVSEKFKSLMPYDLPNKSTSVLELEADNWARLDWAKDTDDHNLIYGQYQPLYVYMISAKRYCLFNLRETPDGGKQIIIRGRKAHGLGHLQLPDSEKNISEIWLWILSKELGLPFQEPEWFHQPALSQFKPSRPHTYSMFNKGEDKPWLKTIKPFNFGILAYAPPWQKMSRPTVQEYYCQRNHNIAYGHCKIKDACGHKKTCLANRNIIPVAPYKGRNEWENWREFEWMDGNTGNPLPVSLYLYEVVGAEPDDCFRPKFQPQPILEPGCPQNSFRFADYMLMVCGYPLHSESKYNDYEGNPCGERTKGRLIKKHIQAKSIKVIGKETNTIVSIEEEEQFSDDITLQQNDVLEYRKPPLHAGNPYAGEKYNESDWKGILKRINNLTKQKKLGKRELAQRLGTTYDTIKNYLKGKTIPSYEIMQKVNAIVYPQGNKKLLQKPIHIRDNGRVYALHAIARRYGWTDKEASDIFKKYLIIVNEVTLININSSETQLIIENRRQEINYDVLCKRQDFLDNPIVNGVVWNNETECYDKITVPIKDIDYFRIKKVNKHVKRVQLLTKSGVKLLVTDKVSDGEIYKLGLLPCPSLIKVDWDNLPEYLHDTVSEWYKYPDGLPYVDINKIASCYNIGRKQVENDIVAGKIDGKEIPRNNGRTIICNPFQAMRLYRNNLIKQDTLKKIED